MKQKLTGLNVNCASCGRKKKFVIYLEEDKEEASK